MYVLVLGKDIFSIPGCKVPPDMAQVYQAKKKGLEISGYFVWTFTDNFEWTEGYYPRFGLVYVDFNTQERIVKSSGKWFANFLAMP